jgi:hypothetical protein
MLSPEWAILPDFEAIAVASSHFEMTRFHEKDGAMKKSVNDILKLARSWVDELVEGTGRRTPGHYDPAEALERVFEHSRPRLPVEAAPATRETFPVGIDVWRDPEPSSIE